MLQGLRRGATRKYKSRYDTGDTPTLFELGTFTTSEWTWLSDRRVMWIDDPAGSGVRVAAYQLNEQQRLAVQLGLKGWENFRDEGGNDIPFTKVHREVAGAWVEVASEETLNALPLEVMRELGNELMRRNRLTEPERKNSGGSSSPSPSSPSETAEAAADSSNGGATGRPETEQETSSGEPSSPS